jgi:hypothetical protein
MQINVKYLVVSFLLLITELIIALFVHDSIIRSHFGDFLIVILMYTLIRGLIGKAIKLLPIYLFIFATIVEVAQYFNIVDMLDLHNNKIAAIIIGTSFDVQDILCYFLAMLVLLMWDSRRSKCQQLDNRKSQT